MCPVSKWMGGRAVEGTGLENRQAFARLVGSNPTPSATLRLRRRETFVLKGGNRPGFGWRATQINETAYGANIMDDNAKKTALRMIPYGIYVLTAEDSDGQVGSATVNWVTQTSFAPPMVVVGVKADSGAYAILKSAGHFALNMLGKGQQGLAFAFFKPAERDGHTISGEPFRSGSSGAPLLLNAQASVECKVVEIVEKGDHHIVIGEVIDATITHEPKKRPDEEILEMKDLGDNVFYGG